MLALCLSSAFLFLEISAIKWLQIIMQGTIIRLPRWVKVFLFFCSDTKQNWVSFLIWGLWICADSWPFVNNAAVSRIWPGSPHILPFPWALNESTKTQETSICSLEETINYPSISCKCFSSTVQCRKPHILHLVSYHLFIIIIPIKSFTVR